MFLPVLKKGENLFIVELTTVSTLNPNYMQRLNDEEYKKTPFLYLLSSYVRNSTLDWADKNLNYVDKRKKYSWEVYKFVF